MGNVTPAESHQKPQEPSRLIGRDRVCSRTGERSSQTASLLRAGYGAGNTFSHLNDLNYVLNPPRGPILTYFSDKLGLSACQWKMFIRSEKVTESNDNYTIG